MRYNKNKMNLIIKIILFKNNNMNKIIINKMIRKLIILIKLIKY